MPIMGKDADAQDDWVKIVSSDGFSFVVRREVAFGSGHLRGVLDTANGGFEESLSGIVNVQERGIIVEKLIEYLMYKKLYENCQNPKDIPDFQERIVPEIALELLIAADYYDA